MTSQQPPVDLVGITVREAMSSDGDRVLDTEMLMEVVRRIAWSGTPAVPVSDRAGRPLGVVTQADIMRYLARGLRLDSTPVGEVATASHVLAPEEPVENAERLIRETLMPLLPVAQNNQLVGVLTMLDIDAQRRLHAALGEHLGNLITDISPTDSMHKGSRGAYVVAGVSALQCVRTAMRSVGKRRVERILDLPSGHGRILRVLKAAFPEAHLTACDIDRTGVDFCAEVLEATPVYSSLDPTTVDFEEPFDLIWCGSLFTHLGAPRWPGFLELFVRSLTAEGVLVFTMHGRHPAQALRAMGVSEEDVNEMLEAYDATGFALASYPGNDEKDWGLTIASPDWVTSRIDEQAGLQFVAHAERAWQPPAPRQDVFTCIRPA